MTRRNLQAVLPVELTISTTQGVRAHLKRLVATGLWGFSVEDAAERLLCQALLARGEAMERRG